MFVPAPDVAALLAELERSEPHIAESARTAMDWLAAGDALETISQLDVCEFLWNTLPMKVSRNPWIIVKALGQLLRLGGMTRYAALCDSPITARILRTYAREGEEAGHAAYCAALEATGVLPPDTPELAWSSIMGPEEAGAHYACAAALELAIVAGEPVNRVELTRRWLTTPRTELGGDCWLHRVHAERLNRWVLGRGAARRELAQPFEVRLHAPIEMPDQPHLEPLRWLLGLARHGVRLTKQLDITRGVAVEAVDRFGWLTRGTIRGETDVPALTALRRILVDELGALRRSGRKLVLTPTGRGLLDDPAALWHQVTSALLAPASGGQEFETSIREATLMLLDGEPLDPAELCRRVAEVVNDEGWRGADDSQVTAFDLARPLGRFQCRLDALGLRADLSRDGPWRLTEPGHAAALAALRVQALRPRRYVRCG